MSPARTGDSGSERYIVTVLNCVKNVLAYSRAKAGGIPTCGPIRQLAPFSIRTLPMAVLNSDDIWAPSHAFTKTIGVESRDVWASQAIKSVLLIGCRSVSLR